MNFKDFFQQHEVLTEISQDTVNKLPSNVKQLLADKKLPFNDIFGDKLRLIEPLKGGKEYKTNISKHVGDQYEIDFDKWVGFKITDKDKKNPVRLGKILSKRKAEFEKFAQNATDKESADSYLASAKAIDDLLKTTNLQKQVTDSEKTSLYVVYSRAPIDVVRMGDMDFDNYSCHSERGEYFYCALADAMMNAGVAYLISEEDYEINRLDIDDNLQVDELFLDNNRGVSGIPALARIRIRLVLDDNGNQLAVPTTKIYAKRGYQFNDDFKEQMINWARRQDTSNFDWDATLSLKGGSYEDAGYKISDQVKLIWGKEVRYADEGDDQEFRDEAENDIYEEHFYDEVVYELDRNEDEEIFNKFWEGDGDIGESESGISISITHRGRIKFSFEIPGPVIDIIGKDVLEATAAGGGKNVDVDGWVFSKRSGNFYFDSYADAPNLWEHGEWWGQYDGGQFDYDGYYEECRGIIENVLDRFSSEGYASEPKEKAFNYRYGFNRRVLEIFGVTVDESESYDKIIAEFLDPSYYYGDETLLLEDFELDHISNLYVSRKENIHYGASKPGGLAKPTLLLPSTTTAKLKTAINTIENHIHGIINETYPNILDELKGITTEYSLALPGQDHSYQELFYDDILSEFERSQNRKVRVKVISTLKHPIIDFKLIHNVSDYDNLVDIIDEMKLQEVYKMVKTVSEMDEDEKEAFMRIDLLQQELRQNRLKEFYDELKKQGQLELDLNRVNVINTNMSRKQTTFDKVYDNIVLEINMAKGGMSNMSGQQGTSAANVPAGVSATPQSGVKMKFAGNPKFSAQTPGAGIQPTATSAGTPNAAVTQDPNEIDEFTNLLSVRQKSPAEFQKSYRQIAQDPDRNARFIDFLLQQPVK